MAAIGCALLVVSLFDAMGSVRSADTMDSIRQLLSRPPGNGTGLSVESAVALLRGLVLFSGALAATGAVLAVYCLRRHRGARLGLSVVAGLMLFTASFVTGFLPVLIAVATSMLWGRDARDWFAGREPTRRQTATREPAAPPTDPGASAATPASWPPPTGPAGPVPGAPAGPGPGDQPPASPYAFGTRPSQAWPAPVPTADPSRRPAAVTAAALLTWIFAGIGALFFVLLVLTLLVDRNQIVTAIEQNPRLAGAGLSTRQIIGTLWVMAAMGIFWSVSAMALAVLAFRRVQLGRIGLVVSALFAAVLATVAVPFGWLHAAAAIATVVLLLLGSTGRWYAAGSSQHRGPGGPPAQQHGGPRQQLPPPPRPQQPTGKPPVW
jgi:hypothetical protein